MLCTTLSYTPPPQHTAAHLPTTPELRRRQWLAIMNADGGLVDEHPHAFAVESWGCVEEIMHSINIADIRLKKPQLIPTPNTASA